MSLCIKLKMIRCFATGDGKLLQSLSETEDWRFGDAVDQKVYKRRAT
jgi:hypothetical protein